jgi:hypothetical protein
MSERKIESLERILRDGLWEMKDVESEKLERKVNVDIDLLVFGGMELDCERLPWNERWTGLKESV